MKLLIITAFLLIVAVGCSDKKDEDKISAQPDTLSIPDETETIPEGKDVDKDNILSQPDNDIDFVSDESEIIYPQDADIKIEESDKSLPADFFGYYDSEKKYVLSWSKPEKLPDLWEIERKMNDEAEFVKVGEISPEETAFRDDGFIKEKEPEYRLVIVADGQKKAAGTVKSAIKTWTLIRFFSFDATWGGDMPDKKEAEAQAFWNTVYFTDNPNINVVSEADYGGNLGSMWGYPDSENPDGFTIIDKPEINFGKPSDHKAFVDWAVEKFPAQRYAFSLWSHGSGPIGAFENLRSVGIDETDSDELDPEETGELFSYITAAGGKKIDVAFFCACLTNTTENNYAIRNYTKYIVAGESVVGCGSELLSTLKSEYGKTSAEIAAYHSEQQIGNMEKDVVFSAVAAEHLSMLALKLNSIAVKIGEAVKSDSMLREKILETAAKTQNMKYMTDSSPNTEWAYLDLVDFLNKISEIKIPGVLELASETSDFIKTRLIIQKSIQNDLDALYPNAGGISIYHPTADYKVYRSVYDKRSFAQESFWGMYLKMLIQE